MSNTYYKNIFLLGIVLLFNINTPAFGQIYKKVNPQKDNKILYLLSPSGTEILEPKSKINIKWMFENIKEILISYSIDGSNWKTINSGVKASKTVFGWQIASEISRQFKIKIADKNNPALFDVTPFYILIKSPIENLNKITPSIKKITSSILKIMPLGNSITVGITDPSPADFNGYRKVLKEKLENSGLEIDFVGSKTNGGFLDNQHEGHGGWHAKHWLDDWDEDIFTNLLSFLQMNPPDIILLHIGTNDIGEYYIANNNNTFNTTVSDVSSLLDIIYNFDSNIKVILAKIINRTDNLSTEINETVTTSSYNSALEIMVNNRIANVNNLSLVDMESALNTSSDLSDGVHPNEVGYSKMANVWFNGIIDVLPKISVKIFLEGNYIDSETMSTLLRNSNVIPLNQPFNTAPWNYNGKEIVESIGTDIVDWVLASLRSGNSASTMVTQKAGFLKSNGSIVDVDGISPLTFVVDEGSYYVVVQHRNHLPVMSATKIYISQ